MTFSNIFRIIIFIEYSNTCFFFQSRKKKRKKNLYIESCRFDFTSDLPDIAKYGTLEKDKNNSRNLSYRQALDCQNNL